MTFLKYFHRIVSKAKQTIISSNCYSINHHKYVLSRPCLNEKYLLDEKNLDEIKENIRQRKSMGDIHKIHDIKNSLRDESLCHNSRKLLEDKLLEEMKKIPNTTHSDVKSYDDIPKEIAYYNDKEIFRHEPFEFSEICKKLNFIRTDHLGNFSGHKTYYLMSDLAELEQALVRYTVKEILNRGFRLMSVPDILPDEVIKSCGMQTDGERNQVYRLIPSYECLSGTSEMALAGYFAGSQLSKSEMPIKVTAVSRCFRAETSSLNEEKGIYRVHQFTKVEMFSVCHSSESAALLDEFKSIETTLFHKLGIHFKILDMPPHELGAPAHRKYDIEAWMPGRKMWGEISSCSNCTDFQSRRLDIKIENEYAHTINGTACAIPRMLIAIIETCQKEDGIIVVPKELQRYMKKDKITRQKILPELKLVKHALK